MLGLVRSTRIEVCLLNFDDENFTEESNPFQSPGIAADRAAMGLNSGILEALRQTRPWLIVIAIVCFVIAGFAILGGIAGAIAMQAFQGGSIFGVGAVVFYILFGAMCIVPGLHLLRYAGRIKSLLVAPTTAGLEEALIAQKSFWKFAGIFVSIIVGLYVLMVLAFVLV